MGHWYRCVALAEELLLRANEVVLLVNPLHADLSAALREMGLPMLASETWSGHDYRRVLEKFPGALMVLDTMDTSVALVHQLRELARVVTIGGSGAGRNHADVRIDGMIPRPGYADGFVGLAHHLGPEYVILRDVFRPSVRVRLSPVVTRVLVALGGDANGAGVLVAQLLVDLLPGVHVDVMMGPLSRQGTALPEHVRIHHNVKNPRPIMESCDLALTSGGMTTYELMRLGVPTLMLPQVPSQDEPSRAFERAGVGFMISREEQSDARRFEAALRSKLEALSDPSVRDRLSIAGRTRVDGGGVFRVADIVQSWSRAASLSESQP